MPKKMSLKQIAANGRNAQKSTGPKTPQGQAVSKMNALKHGIWSKQVLVRGLNAKENSRELTTLYERFWQEYNPVGPVEEMLVDQIVTAHWRWRRALTAESGEIALNVDEGQWKRSRPDVKLMVMGWELAGDPVLAMENSAFGNTMLQTWLGEVRAQVEQDGAFTEAAIQKFHYSHKRNILSKELEELRLRLSQNSNGTDNAPRREENKKEALKYIDRELAVLHWRKAECDKREEAEEEARQAAALLPTAEALDKIMRYETTLHRQMYRAMNQLERLQRMRLGEIVPPPVTMEVSERA